MTTATTAGTKNSSISASSQRAPALNHCALTTPSRMQTSSSNMPVRLAGRGRWKVRTAVSASSQMAASRAIWKGVCSQRRQKAFMMGVFL
ncbi:hypothetical protein D3C79_982430 [compost metagenome]